MVENEPNRYVERRRWVLAEPTVLVRFDLSEDGGQVDQSAMLLLGPVDSSRLRALNLNRLSYLFPQVTPMPQWAGEDPPSLREALHSLPSIERALSLLRGEFVPLRSSAFDLREIDGQQLLDLYETWTRNPESDNAPIAFLIRMLGSASPESPDDLDRAIALGIQIVLPVLARPVAALAESRNMNANQARQLIHRLRNKGYLPRSAREGVK